MNPFPFLIVLCTSFYSSILLQFSSAADSIGLNQSISGNQTTVSPNQRFELGFFSPGISKNRYLGIWYKTTRDVVVWVANRDDPLTDSQGIFVISSNGTPLLLNSTNSTVWSAKVSRKATIPVIQLLDTGNLVLMDEASKNNSSDYLWQSFDYPGDSRLPGMVMGNNSESGVELYLTSWKSTDDPSLGEFIYKVENDGLPQMVIRKGTRKRFRTGPWNGDRFNGLPMFPNSLEGSTNVSSKNGSFSISDRYDNSVITRLTLDQSGSIHRYILNAKTNVWNHMYEVPNNPCDNYGQCGPNGVCNSNNSPMCKCLNGFTEKDPQEWNTNLNWTGGCVRNEPLNCTNGDGFLNVSWVKLPDMLQFQLKMNMNLDDCAAECLRNCSCTAYTNPYVSAGNNGCLMWYGDLVDIRVFDEEKNERTLYVRVPNSELKSTSGSNSKKKKKNVKVILISTASAVLFLGLVGGCIVLIMKRKREELREKVEGLDVPLFDLTTITAATGNFSQENRIGEGGFGPVYKGKLSTGQEVAVKRLSKNSRQGAEEFKSEMNLIAKLQHRNLVRLLGCCIHSEERILIYEYLQNKSLDYFIFDPQRKKSLTWPKRFDIITGIARGLLYLHQDSRLKIIHRDLKTSNILLDSNLEPKISDFGLARIFGGDQNFVETERVIGTYGYMAPEYAMDGKFSEKADVFSFGVLLLEILSGKKNRSFSHPDHDHNLLGHAWLLWNDNRALELIDDCLKDSFVASQVKRCIQVGLLCVQKLVEDRPPMSSVLFMLSNEGAILSQPKEPGFFSGRSISANSEMHTTRSETSGTGDTVTTTL